MTTMMIDAPSCAPPRSRAQRMDALMRANLVRTARKELKQGLREISRPAATERTARFVRQPLAGVTETMKIYNLLVACPGIGQVAANNLLRRLHISPSKTVGGLTPRQRDALGVALDELARQRRMTGQLR